MGEFLSSPFFYFYNNINGKDMSLTFHEVYDEESGKSLLIKAETLDQAIGISETIDFNDFEDGEEVDVTEDLENSGLGTIHEDEDGTFSLYNEAGQLIEGEFVTLEEVKAFAKDNGFTEVKTFFI